MKLWNSCSLAEKQRYVEKDEMEIRQRQQQQLEAEMKQQQQIALMQLQQKYDEIAAKDLMNQRDNDTRVLVAEINALVSLQNSDDGIDEFGNKEELLEKMREFDEKMKLEREKLNQNKQINDKQLKFQEKKLNVDSDLKLKQIRKQNKTSNK